MPSMVMAPEMVHEAALAHIRLEVPRELEGWFVSTKLAKVSFGPAPPTAMQMMNDST